MSVQSVSEVVSLRDAPEILGLDPGRVRRLARFLGVYPPDVQIPSCVVASLKQEDDRYAALRRWVVGQVAQPRAQ